MRRATVRTVHPDAAVVAAALAPDNTPEMSTRVEAGPATDAGDTAGSGQPDEPDRADQSARSDAGGLADESDGRGVVETTIRRETTAGLRSTVDDYVSNLQVAQRVVNDGHDTNP